MNTAYFVLTTSDPAGEHYTARVLEIADGSNIMLALQNIENPVHLTHYASKQEAEARVAYANRCYKHNSELLETLKKREAQT